MLKKFLHGSIFGVLIIGTCVELFIQFEGPFHLENTFSPGMEYLHVDDFLMNQVRDDSDSLKIDMLKEYSKAGIADAQYRLCRLYFHGTGVPRNDRKATILLKKAARQGYTPAQTMLGYCYAGRYLKYKAGNKLLQEAKDKGDLYATYLYGYYRYVYKSDSVSCKECLDLLLQSRPFDKNLYYPTYVLAQYYRHFPLKMSESYLLKEGALAGSTKCMIEYASRSESLSLYAHQSIDFDESIGFAKKALYYGEENCQEPERLVLSLYEQKYSFGNGSNSCLADLDSAFAWARRIPVHQDKSYIYYIPLLECCDLAPESEINRYDEVINIGGQQELEAYFHIAQRYDHRTTFELLTYGGLGTSGLRNGQFKFEQDYGKAAHYYELCINSNKDVKEFHKWNDAKSYYCLSQLYYGGPGLDQNYDKVFEYLTKASELSTYKPVEASINEALAKCYENGYGTEIDYKKAAKFLKKAKRLKK